MGLHTYGTSAGMNLQMRLHTNSTLKYVKVHKFHQALSNNLSQYTQDVKTSKTSSERLMYVQFTSCVYWGVALLGSHAFTAGFNKCNKSRTYAKETNSLPDVRGKIYSSTLAYTL